MRETRGTRDHRKHRIIVREKTEMWCRDTSVVWLIDDWFSVPENVMLLCPHYWQLCWDLYQRVSTAVALYTSQALLDLIWSLRPRLIRFKHLGWDQNIQPATPHAAKSAIVVLSDNSDWHLTKLKCHSCHFHVWWAGCEQKVSRALGRLKVWHYAKYKQWGSDTLPGPVKQIWRSWHLQQPHRDKAA